MRLIGLVCLSSLVFSARGSRTVTLDDASLSLTFRGLWSPFSNPAYAGGSVLFASGAGASVTTGALAGGTDRACRQC